MPTADELFQMELSASISWISEILRVAIIFFGLVILLSLIFSMISAWYAISSVTSTMNMNGSKYRYNNYGHVELVEEDEDEDEVEYETQYSAKMNTTINRQPY